MDTFRIDNATFRKSSFSKTDWTQKDCVGVACDDSCVKVADSTTQDLVLSFPKAEFAAFLAGLDRL